MRFFYDEIDETAEIAKRYRIYSGGILLGPYCFGLVPEKFIEGSAFLSDIALAFIAFSTGEFFTLKSLKKNGAKS